MLSKCVPSVGPTAAPAGPSASCSATSPRAAAGSIAFALGRGCRPLGERHSVGVGRDGLSAVPRSEGPDDLLGRARLQEADRAIRDGNVTAARMVAAHAVHAGTVEVTGPEACPAIRIRS